MSGYLRADLWRSSASGSVMMERTAMVDSGAETAPDIGSGVVPVKPASDLQRRRGRGMARRSALEKAA